MPVKILKATGKSKIKDLGKKESMLFESVYILRINLVPSFKAVKFLRHGRSHIPLFYATAEKGIYTISYFSLLIRGAFLASEDLLCASAHQELEA